LPIIEQIKEEEGLTAFEAYSMIREGGGFPVEVRTDCIGYVCVPEDDGSAIVEPNIRNADGSYKSYPGIFWDPEQTIPKFKWEEPHWNKAERANATRPPPKCLPIAVIGV